MRCEIFPPKTHFTAPDKLVTLADGDRLLPLDIVRVAAFVEIRLSTNVVGEISPQRDGRTVDERLLPVAENVVTVEIPTIIGCGIIIPIAPDGVGGAVAGAVDGETTVGAHEGVTRMGGCYILCAIRFETVGKDAVTGVPPKLAAVAQAGAALIDAAGGAQEKPLSLRSVLGDDIDDAVDGIGAPHGAARAADNLDAVDIVERHVDHLPRNAGAYRLIDAAAVDQHQ